MNNFTDNNDVLSSYDALGRYVLPDYDHQKPFSSFLPGIAGLQGIPMWAFYVNRGQAVCSFGVADKDHPILEFQAANKAYQTTALMGFRTFLNGLGEGEKWQREAFSPWDAEDTQRTMSIGMNEVEVQEINTTLGYQVNVLYFMLPGMPFSGLVRRVSIKNITVAPMTLEVLDGLPGIVPYGVDNGALKHISRTIEAWMQVDNLENKLPFYRLKATPGDTAAVQAIHSGNYALAFCDGDLCQRLLTQQPFLDWIPATQLRTCSIARAYKPCLLRRKPWKVVLCAPCLELACALIRARPRPSPAFTVIHGRCRQLRLMWKNCAHRAISIRNYPKPGN
jgi:hypothetical protein